ncbi:MAG: hypothetical protein ACRELZ_19105 [Candidatus Rokuibacteriota bacterium]
MLAVVTVAVLSIGAIAIPARFIGEHCFSVRFQPRERSPEVVLATADISGYQRDPSSTFLTLPAWYVVYSAEEYAAFVKSRAPSQFPYFAAIRQYWRYYTSSCGGTKRVYPFDARAHLILALTGMAFTIDNTVKGAYENTVGVVSESIGFYHTEEDVFARKSARQYAERLHTIPWYDYPFADRLEGLWKETPLWGLDIVRKWERRFALSVEYALMATYAGITRLGTHRVRQPEDLVIHAWIEGAPERIFDDDRIRKIKAVGAGSYIVTIPRLEAFTPMVTGLAKQGVRFRELAGNDEIVLTVIAPTALDFRLVAGDVLLTEPLLTNPGATRIAVKAPVESLHAVLADLASRGVTVERLYDY